MLALALALPALALALGSADPPLPLLHGQGAAPDAWVAVSEGQLWVCWEGRAAPDRSPSPGCWRRLPLELAAPANDDTQELLDDDAEPDLLFRPAGVDASAGGVWVGFSDPSTLWVVSGANAWIVDRNGLAAAVADPPLELELDPLAPLLCDDEGWLPSRAQGVWSWRRAPCEEAAPCRRAPALRRPRRATGARIDLAGELALVRRLRAGDRRQSELDGAAFVSLGVTIDRRAAQRERQLLARWRRFSAPGALPPPRTRGELADVERAALVRAQCRAWEGIR
ncbi:MAG: hypothetical protein H6710_03795 [Myxococcales bacterium]|nr:hypothetical protein [Myxococcales bacterium]